MIATLIGAASVGAWLYLLLGRGFFWRVEEAPEAAGPMVNARVTVVIPARNEADGIARTVRSLLTQNHPGPLTIVLVDDHSTDGTADLARAAARAVNAADRLIVLPARDLPSGWTGKLWAVSEGLDRARETAPDFILLTDADITHAPDNVSTLVRRSLADDLDLTSLMVRLSTETLPERALIPAFVFFFFMLYPPRWAANPASKLAAAAGGCMLVRPAALEKIGGIAAIRGALIDDCSLAAAIKRAGGRIRLDPSTRTRSSRVYGSAREIWSMIARTAFTQLHYSTPLLVGTLLGLGVTYLAPPLLTIFSQDEARWLGIVAWLAMAACFYPTVRLYDRSAAWAFALPAIALFYSAATFGSAVNYWRGKGGQWKGRAQAIR